MMNLRKVLSYTLYFVLAVVVLSGCDNNEGVLGWHNEISTKGIEKDYKIVVIDSCEYIMYDAGSGYAGNGFLAHKGNCKFCAKRNKH